MRWAIACVLVLLVGVGCEKKVPSELEDLKAVAATGKLQDTTDTSFGVTHETEATASTMFGEYSRALEAKGWRRIKEDPKPEIKAHNGCFEREGKTIAVSVHKQGEKTVGVIAATGCVI